MKRSPGISVGGASIVSVFVVLCLFVLAALSLINANSDLALAQKTADGVADYYAADLSAEKALCLLAKAKRLEQIEAAGFKTKTQNGRLVAFRTFTVNEYKNLYIELDCGNADAPDCKNATRLCWRVFPSQQYDTDDPPKLMG